MSAQAQRFVRGWVIACVLLAASVAVVNAVVDPYLLFGMPRLHRFNQRKPSVERQERLMKAYEVLRAAPTSLILGTSRVAIGLDARHPSWPPQARPVYNLGLAGADIYTSYRYLQHVLSRRDLAIVVFGLDFEYFLDGKPRDRSAPMAFEPRLAVGRDGRPNSGAWVQWIRDLTDGTLSLEALSDSAATVSSNLGSDSIDLSPSGNLSEAGFRRATEEVGAYLLFAQRNQYNIRTYRGRTFALDGAEGADVPALADLRALVDLCRSRGVHVELFIQPMHADLLETLDLLGMWPAYEAWKRQLVALSGRDGQVRVWDFSGYDQYSTETLPPRSDRRAHLRWFWEPTHYSNGLGDIILARILGGSDTGYGALLTHETLEARLGEIREQRALYRQRHPEAVRRVGLVYESAAGGAPRAAAPAP